MAIPSDSRDVLVAELREAFGRVAYSHKTQEKEADRKKATDDRVRLWQIILSAVTTAGLLGILVSDTVALEVVSTAVAAAMSFLAAYAKNFRAGELAAEHQACAHRLWLIREQYLSLLADLEASAVSLTEARTRRDGLQARLAEIYEAAPRTTPQAYAAAQQALQRDQELTFSDAEIDAFLPARLRKAAPSAAPASRPALGPPPATALPAPEGTPIVETGAKDRAPNSGSVPKA